MRGTLLIERGRFIDALAAFEEAIAERDSPWAEYDVGVCDINLNRFVALREVAQRLVRDPGDLPPSMQDDVRRWRDVFAAQNVVRVAVDLEPADSVLLVDGATIVPDPDEAGAYLGGLSSKEPPGPVGRNAFVLMLDPGMHQFRATRPGHEPVTVRKTFQAGDASARLDLRLETLPATVTIRSVPAGASVLLEHREVGLAPIEIRRPSGRYHFEIALDGYDSAVGSLDLTAGQEVVVDRTLHTPPLTKRWWFWTGIAVVVGAGAAITYVITRPAPQPPPYDPGSANWLVRTESFHF